MTEAGSSLGSGATRGDPRAGAARTRARREANALEESLAVLGLGAVVALLLWPALLGRRVFFERDILSYWLPQVTSFVRAVAVDGAWPLWSPLFGFGQPMLEDPSYQILYPLTWLNLLVEPGAYYVSFVALHGLWAGLGLYKFGRTLGLGGLDAWTAAAVFCASGPFLSAANLHHHFAGLAWAPWVLLALDRVLSTATVRAGLILGAAAGLQALAGSGDLCLMTGALCLGYAAWSRVRGPERRSSWSRALACLSLALAFAFGLSAAQILPASALLGAAPRAALNPETNMYWSIHPASLLDLFVDRVVAGFPMSQALRASLFESRAPFLASLYLGLPTGLLVALGAFSPGRPRWGPWLLAGFGLCLLGALGHHAPVFPILLKIPVVQLFRYPAKLMLPASLLWALLVGLGSMAWQRTWAPGDRRRGASVAAFGLLVGAGVLVLAHWVDGHPNVLMPLAATSDQAADAGTTFAGTTHALQISAGAGMATAGVLAARLAFARPPAWLSATLLAAVLGNLVAVGRTVQPLAPAALLRHRPPVLERLPPAGGIRVLSVAAGIGLEPARGPAGWDPSWAAALGAVESLRAPSAARWRIAGSFDGDFTGLAPHAQAALSRWVLNHRGSALGHRLLALGSVDYVIAVGEAGFPGLEPVAEFPSVFGEPIRLSKVPDALPKIYWVSRARFVPQGDPALAALAEPSFDPRAEVVLTVGDPLPAGSPGSRAAWRVVERRSDRLRLEISADGPGYLVVVEAYAPGWRARIDASSVPLLRANALFRAVPVPKGAHEVEMTYRPPAAYVGAGVSALTLLGGIGLWVHRGRRRGVTAG